MARRSSVCAASLGRCAGDLGVHCLSHLGIAAFVGISDEQTKLELAAHLLSPLDHEPELLDTLEAFFAQNCCPSETARRLVIHRNTLAYRLQKVALLTGLDPRRFADATQIHLALLMRSLGPAPS
jgi:carbohydrate diacid regulator